LDKYLPDAIDTYRLAIESKKKHMDMLFAKKEESYQRFLLKKQKTTPLTSTLNEQKTNLVHLLKQYVKQANDKKVPLSKTDRSATDRYVSSNKPHKKRHGKRGTRNGASETTKGTTSNGTKSNNVTQISKNSNNHVSAKQQHNQHVSEKLKSTIRKPYQTNNVKMSYASAVKGNNSRYVVIDEDDNINDTDPDGFTKVKGKTKKHSNNHQLSRKNQSASDPRNVPKGKR
jgi:hypothetical protein